MIQVGDTVRVLSEGIFQGQMVKVLKIDPKESHRQRAKDWYFLDVVHPNDAFHGGWFEAHEIEPVEATS